MVLSRRWHFTVFNDVVFTSHDDVVCACLWLLSSPSAFLGLVARLSQPITWSTKSHARFWAVGQNSVNTGSIITANYRISKCLTIRIGGHGLSVIRKHHLPSRQKLMGRNDRQHKQYSVELICYANERNNEYCRKTDKSLRETHEAEPGNPHGFISVSLSFKTSVNGRSISQIRNPNNGRLNTNRYFA